MASSLEQQKQNYSRQLAEYTLAQWDAVRNNKSSEEKTEVTRSSDTSNSRTRTPKTRENRSSGRWSSIITSLRPWRS
ncbi:hypothetical protein PM082_003076 [Marasmius tenuissimus]|nr:hypothetical protein PM082_003076 [Marasmius tenuissimus]